MSDAGWQNFLDVRRTEAGEAASMVTVGFIRRYHIPKVNWKMDFYAGDFDSYQWALTPMPQGGSAVPRKLAWNTIELMRSSPEAPAGATVGGQAIDSSMELGGKTQTGLSKMTEVDASEWQWSQRAEDSYSYQDDPGEWNKDKKITVYRKPYPLWWDLAGNDPNIGGTFKDSWAEHRGHKNIGGAIKGVTDDAAMELRDILDYEGGTVADVQTSKTAPEEMWTDFVMEGVAKEIAAQGKGKDIGATDDMLDYVNIEQDRMDDDYMHLINPLGIDFLSASHRELLEHRLFNVLIDNAFDEAGSEWFSKTKKTTSVGREQTSAWATKYFSEDLIKELSTGKDIKQAFEDNTQNQVDRLRIELRKIGGDLVSQIHSIKSGGKTDAGFEDLLYFAKQTADRALNLALSSYFGYKPLEKGGEASYDYFLPIPPQRSGDYAAGTWLGQIRITPKVKVEEIRKEFDSQSYKGLTAQFLGIEANTRVIFQGGSPAAGTMATPLNVILASLADSQTLSKQTVNDIISDAQTQMEEHQTALTGVSLAGAGYWQELQSNTIGEKMAGSAGQIDVVNIAAGNEIAENLHGQITDVLGSPQVESAMKDWLNKQKTRTNSLSNAWAIHMKGVFNAHEKFAKKQQQLIATLGLDTSVLPFANPFQKDPMKTNMGGRLVGIPAFLAKGPGAGKYVEKMAVEGMSPMNAASGKKASAMSAKAQKTLWGGGSAGGLATAQGPGHQLWNQEQRLTTIPKRVNIAGG